MNKHEHSVIISFLFMKKTNVDQLRIERCLWGLCFFNINNKMLVADFKRGCTNIQRILNEITT